MTDIDEVLTDLLLREASPRGAAWFRGAPFALRVVWDRKAFLDSFAAATLRLGKALVELGPAEQAALAAAAPGHWHRFWIDELGRAVLLLLAAERAPAQELPALLRDCYAHGENRERQAVLRALPLLPHPERFVSLAVEACRTHVQPVFEAIACENAYPSRYFPELHFNQMVLKSLFNGVALERVVGLERRLNAELGRMATDYAREREAAGRTIPADIARFITGPLGPRSTTAS